MPNLPRTLALFMVSPVAVAGQNPPDVCRMFSAADVAVVIGQASAPGRAIIPGTCVWTGKGISLTIATMDAGEPAAALALVQAAKSRAQKGEVVKDEAGLGQRAVSTIAANRRGISLVAADAKTSWNLTLDSGHQAIDAATALPRLRDLLKKGMAAR
jgi:hypothetical protein